MNSKTIGETVAKRNKVLVELLNGVAQMPLFSADGVQADLFGGAYEYLMGMYAANAGKKGGQYFTPADGLHPASGKFPLRHGLAQHQVNPVELERLVVMLSFSFWHLEPLLFVIF